MDERVNTLVSTALAVGFLAFVAFIAYVFLYETTRVGEWGHGCRACDDKWPVCWVEAEVARPTSNYRENRSIIPAYRWDRERQIPAERLCNKHWRRWERITRLEEEVFDE